MRNRLLAAVVALLPFSATPVWAQTQPQAAAAASPDTAEAAETPEAIAIIQPPVLPPPPPPLPCTPDALAKSLKLKADSLKTTTARIADRDVAVVYTGDAFYMPFCVDTNRVFELSGFIIRDRDAEGKRNTGAFFGPPDMVDYVHLKAPQAPSMDLPSRMLAAAAIEAIGHAEGNERLVERGRTLATVPPLPLAAFVAPAQSLDECSTAVIPNTAAVPQNIMKTITAQIDDFDQTIVYGGTPDYMLFCFNKTPDEIGVYEMRGDGTIREVDYERQVYSGVFIGTPEMAAELSKSGERTPLMPEGQRRLVGRVLKAIGNAEKSSEQTQPGEISSVSTRPGRRNSRLQVQPQRVENGKVLIERGEKLASGEYVTVVQFVEPKNEAPEASPAAPAAPPAEQPAPVPAPAPVADPAPAPVPAPAGEQPSAAPATAPQL